jgi:hypothetical protein
MDRAVLHLDLLVMAMAVNLTKFALSIRQRCLAFLDEEKCKNG